MAKEKESNIIDLAEYRGMHNIAKLYRCGMVLLGWAVTEYPDGDLSDLTDDDIADIAGWEGDSQELISTLLNMKILRKKKTGYFLVKLDGVGDC